MSWELDNWPLPAPGPVDLEIAIILDEEVTSIQNNITGSPNANVSFIEGVTLNTQHAVYTISLVTFYAEGIEFDQFTAQPTQYITLPVGISANWTIGTNIQYVTFTLQSTTSPFPPPSPFFVLIRKCIF